MSKFLSFLNIQNHFQLFGFYFSSRMTYTYRVRVNKIIENTKKSNHLGFLIAWIPGDMNYKSILEFEVIMALISSFNAADAYCP